MEKPKIPLLGNGMSETAASLGTWKGSFASALVRHGCGVFASLGEQIPTAYPTDPKQAGDTAVQKRYEDLVAMFKGKYNVENTYQLENKSMTAYALLHEAVAKTQN